MGNALKFAAFALIELALVPLLVLGMVLYALRLVVKQRRQGISGTAYEPLWVRLLLHEMGVREDAACKQLAPHLPATSPLVLRLVAGPLALAPRLSGYTPSYLVYPVPAPSSLMMMVSHRTEFFDRTLRDFLDAAADQDAGRQVVILGAGWDTRAYGVLEARGVRVFEVDAPATQRAKKDALEKAGIDAGHVTFVEADFNRQSWLDAATARGFDPAKPAYILWEGVSMYLEEGAVIATLRSVASLAQGSRIAFDYLSSELIGGKTPFSRFWKLLSASVVIVYGERFVFGISTRPPAREQVADYLASRGGLELEQYETFGQERGRKRPFGGLALAVKMQTP